jgi:hypothetical protein
MSSDGTGFNCGDDGERPDGAPPHLTADEKHTRYQKQKAYLAVTAAGGCIFGSELCASAGYEDLEPGYGVFQQEAAEHVPEYVPQTITLDGWEATRQAWESRFPGIVWILCFLHEVIKIRDLCRSQASLWELLQEKLWQVYHGNNKRQFSQRLRRLLEWSKKQNLRPSIAQRLGRLRGKSLLFQRAYDFPEAARTSNAVDRPMNFLDRSLFAMQYFHGSWDAAVQSGRAMAMLWNFHPFCRKIQRQSDCLCPFEVLNGFRYHDDWFRNFLIASSLNGRRPLISSSHTK